MEANPAERLKNRAVWLVIGGTVLLILLFVLSPRGGDDSRSGRRGEMSVIFHEEPGSDRTRKIARPSGSATGTATPEEQVAAKVSQFARSRREIALGLARKHGVEVPAEVERFFDAVEAGNWEEIERLFKSLRAQQQAKPPVKEIDAVWPTIMETFGVASETRGWPAQKLLDYGNAIMGTLRPDMVYVGGTDPGRFIPALMNTSEGERHVVITQNALADQKYLEYVQFVYGDRFAALAPEDAVTAQKQSGIAEGELQSSGFGAIMAVNEVLLKKLLEKNPNLSFALEESFPMTSLNAEATPMGPIMELRAQEQNSLTQERAAQSVEYWRQETRRLMADPEFTGSDYAKKSYSKLVSSQAGLLMERNYLPEAEEALRFANELCPYSPEAVFRYVNLLVSQKRVEEAARVAKTGISADPRNQQFIDLAAELGRMQK